MSRAFAHGSFTIESGQTASGSFAISGMPFGSLQQPAAFTGTKFSFECELANGAGWKPILYPKGHPLEGDPVEMTFEANAVQRIPDEVFPAIKLRVVSDATEGADRTFFYHVQE